MQILYNESLAKYTTLRLGGIADTMIIPESEDELLSVCKAEEFEYILGGGSNLLISSRRFALVLNLKKFNTNFFSLGEGKYYAGASLKLNELIKRINNDGYGGIEYLCTVPGLVGGAVAMNAGKGEIDNQNISDYIEEVKVVNVISKEIQTFNKEECGFCFRNSIFKNNHDYIICSVLFCFDKIKIDDVENKKREKIEYSKNVQDMSAPNCGSVYSTYSNFILKCAKRIGLGRKKIHFSKKSLNWILNDDGTNGDYAIRLIRFVRFLHLLLRKDCKIEVVIWE